MKGTNYRRAQRQNIASVALSFCLRATSFQIRASKTNVNLPIGATVWLHNREQRLLSPVIFTGSSTGNPLADSQTRQHLNKVFFTWLLVQAAMCEVLEAATSECMKADLSGSSSGSRMIKFTSSIIGRADMDWILTPHPHFYTHAQTRFKTIIGTRVSARYLSRREQVAAQRQQVQQKQSSDKC